MGDLGPGDVVINEIMANPEACGDRDNVGEYIEVWNATASEIDLNCLSITDGGGHVGFVETSTVVAPLGYAVLQRSSESM